MRPPLTAWGILVRVVFTPLILLGFILWALGEITLSGDK